MHLNISGLPAIVMGVGFLVVFSTPVWFAARIIGADRPALIRSFLAVLAGLTGAVLSAAFFGALAFLLAPLSFLLAIKYVLGTSMLGAVFLAILAAAGYAAMVHFIGGGVSISPNGGNA